VGGVYIERGGYVNRIDKFMLIGMYIAASADIVVAIGVVLLLLN
jgi:hypothetical protein